MIKITLSAQIDLNMYACSFNQTEDLSPDTSILFPL